MDYESEQSMEMEALEAILMDDLQPFTGTMPSPWTTHAPTYKVTILPEDSQGEDAEFILELIFAHTPTYPDEPPCLRVRSAKGISDAECRQVQEQLEAEVQNNLGMSMVFNLVTMAREWLQNKDEGGEAEEDPEVARKKAEEAEEAKRAAARAHGHMVTVEAFNAWQAKFEAERAALKGEVKDDRKSRLTGKQFFLQAAAAEVEEAGSEDGALSEDDEVDLHHQQQGGRREDGAGDDEDEDLDFDDDDDDDDEMLDEYLAAKQ